MFAKLLLPVKNWFTNNVSVIVFVVMFCLAFWGWIERTERTRLTEKLGEINAEVKTLKEEKENLYSLMKDREAVNDTIQRQLGSLSNDFKGIHLELNGLRSGLGEITQPGEEVSLAWKAYDRAYKVFDEETVND